MPSPEQAPPVGGTVTGVADLEAECHRKMMAEFERQMRPHFDAFDKRVAEILGKPIEQIKEAING